MSDNQSSRRKFLRFLGITAGVTAGASLMSTNVLASFINKEEILKLKPDEQEFMIRYGKWMDEFIETIRVQKTDQENIENNKRIIALSEQAEAMKPELDKFMKDEKFAMIYRASIERVTNEI